MKRRLRLRRQSQFQRVRREGRILHHQFLLLNAARNYRRGTRCGFVVGKRIGNAVKRNRAKRRVREAVRRTFDHIVDGMDLVFVVRTTDVLAISFPRLQAVIENLLRRAGIWRDSPHHREHPGDEQPGIATRSNSSPA